MRYPYLILLLIVGLLPTCLSAQRQNNNWYFGSKAGLNFNNGAPVFQSSELNVLEGSSVISDSAGNLLMYTDGSSVWNQYHRKMPGGTGLRGGSGSSTQAALIVKYPANDSLYYIFTMDQDNIFTSTFFFYSLVNIRGNNGEGSLVTKNKLLIGAYGQEKAAGIMHSNGEDIWIVTRGWKGNLSVFRITRNGLIEKPIEHDIGSKGEYHDVRGWMKFSPDGTKLASCYPTSHIELLDFNTTTGIPSNPMKVPRVSPGAMCGPYGLEFSCDSKLLYVTEIFDCGEGKGHALSQYDLTDYESSKIQASRVIIDYQPDAINRAGALQMGPDNKIYVSMAGESFIGAITNPGVRGTGCGFVKQYVEFPATAKCAFGLPTFLSPYKLRNADFTYSTSCGSDFYNFTVVASSVDSISWNFGDPASGLANRSQITNAIHNFSVSGTYTVTAIIHSMCSSDTISKSIVVNRVGQILPNDTSICAGSVLTITTLVEAPDYLWEDGTKNRTTVASLPGAYHVAVTINGCLYRDTLNLQVVPLVKVALGNDTTICEKQVLKYDVSFLNADSYAWSNGSASPTITIDRAGTFSVIATKNGCTGADTVNVSQILLPKASLGPDVTVCSMDTVINLYGGVADSYSWSDGSTGATLAVKNPGLYSITLSNSCGSATDQVLIKLEGCNLSIPSAFTPNDDRRNDVFRVLNTGAVSKFHMEIFNRWGQRVFVSTYAQSGWDGRVNGQVQPSGLYVWRLSYTTQSGEQVNDKGTVTLIR